MKVLIVISNAGIGGTQRVAINLASWMNQREEHSALVVSLEDFDGNKYDTSAIPYRQIEKGTSKILGLISVIRECRPDIVLSMGVPMAVYTVPACLITHAKHIVSERNDPAHFAGKSIIRVLSRCFMKWADAYVFQTKEAQAFYGGSVAGRSAVIPNPLFSAERMPTAPYAGERKKTIVSVGRLSRQKNQRILIEAFYELQPFICDYQLIIWGEGAERERLNELISALKLQDKVSLPGSTDKVFDEIYEAGLFVLCSDFEGMPNALMEAMALGLPCISTDCPCGGPRELIRNGVNGILVPVGDKEALKTAILHLVNQPAELREEMQNMAFRIRETHSLESICQSWYKYFSEVKAL